MSENASVVIFPSVFAQNKLNSLVSNIKKILEIKNQQFRNIRKDDSVIVVDANDPVFASSSINLLFGIERIAIAKKVKNEFDGLVSDISKIGSNLLLKGDRFYVKVEGKSKGYLPKDVEIAATSALIEKTTKLGARPGTEDRYDKLIYTYLTKSNAYVCIFTDKGNGGIPNNFQKEKLICCIYDELSAVSCLESIREGFDVKILICFQKESDLLQLVKIINNIISRTLKSEIELEFLQIPINKSSTENYLLFVETVVEIILEIASSKFKRVTLAVTPLIFPQPFIDRITNRVIKKNIIPHIPLSGLNENIFDCAKDIGLEKYLPRLEKLGKMKFNSVIERKKSPKKIAQQALTSKRTVNVTIGPNNIHDILDSLESNH